MFCRPRAYFALNSTLSRGVVCRRARPSITIVEALHPPTKPTTLAYCPLPLSSRVSWLQTYIAHPIVLSDPSLCVCRAPSLTWKTVTLSDSCLYIESTCDSFYPLIATFDRFYFNINIFPLVDFLKPHKGRDPSSSCLFWHLEALNLPFVFKFAPPHCWGL